MHNFAQRRSFMMGGFDRSNEFQHPHIQQKSQQQEVESNRVYRVENNDDEPLGYDDYPIDTPLGEGTSEIQRMVIARQILKD